MKRTVTKIGLESEKSWFWYEWNIWWKMSEGIDEIEPLGILDDVSTIVNITCGYKRDEKPVY